MEKQPVSNIIFGTMTIGREGYGARVGDLALAGEMLDVFAGFGHRDLDTSENYGGGSCEAMLGELAVTERFTIATRFHAGPGASHTAPEIRRRLGVSLARLNTQRTDVFYLSLIDPDVPLEETLGAVDALHREGVIGELGLSNISAWRVAEIVETTRRKGWLAPTVYQGIYNAVTRPVEPELLPCLRRYGLRFHVFNPLAGGALATGVGQEAAVAPGSRFDAGLPQGQAYRRRYWNDAYGSAIAGLQATCGALGLNPAAVALRWMVHHSALDGRFGDGVIVGASKPEHLRANLAALKAGPLPQAALEAIETANAAAAPQSPPYFFAMPR
ncbi:aldo/keto reductase family protein [Phenylobacterium immobile]|uniref:aldo/keto reductase family protein n=1 Tax=Phenylobacterium immobile TaxID=21 RepID=UPI000A4825E2|nr:aldo/keto reductase [Phenylobacterium immobile]